MKQILQPLVFTPVYKTKNWGGNRIASFPGRQNVPSPCGESWELSAHPDGPTVLKNGSLAGKTLAEAVSLCGANLLGTAAPAASTFPLLFKIIDAADKLSVQVHPNNANAALTGGEPKTEMWFVLDAEPGACLYAGLKPGVTPQFFEAAILGGTAADLLVKLPVKPGQILFIPGGLVHAIGAGCLVYEVQQSSNTTYRLYDWNHKGKDGKPRQLHVAQGLKTIDWSLPPPVMRLPRPLETHGGNAWSDVVTCNFFHMRKLDLAAEEDIKLDGRSFHALFAVKGSVKVTAGGAETVVQEKSSCLLPADAREYALTPTDSAATVLVTSLP